MRVFFLLFFSFSAICFGQESTNPFAEDMKRLIEHNNQENYHNLSGKEAVNIYQNANFSQIIEITAPYLNSKVLNAREISLFMLFDAFHKKAKTPAEKQQIVEIICQNFVNEKEIQIMDNFLALLMEKDFTNSAKKEVEKLISSDSSQNTTHKIRWLSYAQITKSVPVIWAQVKKDKKNFEKRDLIMLASLARLGEKEAGVKLCNYYKSTINRTNYEYVFTAKQIAFSFDETVLQCLVDDYKTMDINWNYRDGDTGFTPSQVVGGAITEMIKNYPYKKGEYNIDPKQLLYWLNQNNQYELNEK